MHSVSDLTTFSRKTTGDVPPRLVGASTTVVGDKMYLFGGRLVTERRMVSDMYVFDMETYVWEKIQPTPGDDVPGARYFHSTDAWKNQLVVFGGMGHKPGSESVEELYVLNDVRFFDLAKRKWLPAHPQQELRSPSPQASDTMIPRARYAHLSAITSSRLFIIGGQDVDNLWLDDLCVFDLVSLAWVQRRAYPRHSGTYRSVAVAGNLRVRYPSLESKSSQGTQPSPWGPLGSRFSTDKTPPVHPEFTPDEDLVHQPYTSEPTDDFPNDIFLYSNYNFTDVKRELEVFTPLPGSDFKMTDLSSNMTGSALPPGLRFPTGAICGNFLIFGGTYLAHSYQSFSIWALDLHNMTWMRLDPGAALATGSWFKGCLWSTPGKSRFMIFGNRHGNLVEDYNRRLLSWDDVACIDLEAFGIYQPPSLALDIKAQELGLAALEEELLADFEVVCDDGRKIKCSRKVLENRWPWFKEQRKLFLESAARALESIPSSSGDTALPTAAGRGADSEADVRQPDPRLTPRSLLLSEPFPITLALLQYLYSMALLTPLQHAPAVLSQLLLLSATYELSHLQSLVKHAMHRALSSATSVGVYEVATLCSCQSLQIRALKLVMSSSRRAANSSTSSRVHPGGADGPGGRDGGGGGSNPGARPRGMSDLRGPHGDNGHGPSSRAYNTDSDQLNGRHRSPQTPDAPDSSNRPLPVARGPSANHQHRVQLSMDSLRRALQTVTDEMVGDESECELPYARGDLIPDSTVDANFGAIPVQHGQRPSTASSRQAFPSPPTGRGDMLRVSAAHPDIIHRVDSASSFDAYSDRSSTHTPAPAHQLSHQRSQATLARSDGDTPSLWSSPSMGSLTTSTSSYRTQHSPTSPESPAVATPVTPTDGFFPSMATLSSIEERNSYDEGRAVDLRDESKALVREDTRITVVSRGDAFGTQQESFWADPPSSPEEPLRLPGSRFGAHHSGSGSALHLPWLFSSSTDKLGRDAAKARAKAEKLEQKLREKEERARAGRAGTGLSKVEMKAAKDEDKRRKKDAEKARIEQLAIKLKARAMNSSDGGSILSSTSSERRAKAANGWVEKSDGMYGGLGGFGL